MATLTTSWQQIASQYIGTISGSGVAAKDVYVKIYAKYNSQNITNNQSSVSYKSTLYVTGSGTYFYTGSPTTKALNGSGATAVSGGAQGDYYIGETTLYEITGTVTHSSSGTANVSASASWSSGPWGVSGTANGTASLPTIPRTSSFSLSATSVNVDASITANITKASSSFTHKVRFYINDTYTSQTYTTSGTSQSFTIPASWLPSSTSCTAYCNVATYSGSTYIGYVTKSFTINVPNTTAYQPKVGTITLDPANITTKDGTSRNILVQGKNKITVSVSGCSAGSGSSIKSYTFSGPGISNTTTNTSVTSSGVISNTGTLTYTVTVTDNRGRAVSQQATITCYAYTTPSFKTFSAIRCNSSGAADENGTYIKCSYTLAYSAVNSTNKINNVTIYYKKNTASNYSSTKDLENSTSTSGSKILNSISTSSTYTLYATITDNYSGSSSSSSSTVFSVERVINVRPDGSGIALGKMAESDNLFDVKWPISTDESAQTMKNLTYKGTNTISSTTNDTTSNWGDQGNLATVFYTTAGKITDQPSQYGFVLNLTNGPDSPEVHQLWATQSGGDMLHRGGNSNGWNGTWRTIFDSLNYTNYVSKKPTTLYNSAGNAGTVTLSQSAVNFTYLEVFYTDNNSNGQSSTRVYSPNGKKIDLSIIEPSDNTAARTYIRRTLYTISGTTITPSVDVNGGYIQIDGGTVTTSYTDRNFLKIVRVLGYN